MEERYAASEGREIELLVGRLPDMLPVEIPLPDEVTVVGSLVRGGDGIDIVLDTPLSPEQVRDFYGQRMPTAGWTDPEPPGPSGGFTPDPSYLGMIFCRGARGPSLEVVTRPLEDAPNDLRLRITTNAQHSPCTHIGRGSGYDLVIPPLSLPPGARFAGGGGGGSGADSAHTNASIEGNLELATVAAHYAAQFEQAGWSRTGEGQGGPQAWHTWAFTNKEGEPWAGVFTVLQLPMTPRQFFLQVHANWAQAS